MTTAHSWGAVAFHRPLSQQQIESVRFRVVPQFLPSEERIEGLSAEMAVSELKARIAEHLGCSPRVRIVLRLWGAVLQDAPSLRAAKVTHDSLVEVLLLPLSADEVEALIARCPPTSVRVRPMLGPNSGALRGDALLQLQGLRADTTIAMLKRQIVERRLLEGVPKEAVERARLMFHPAFHTWEVLLVAAALPDEATVLACRLTRDDILYLAPEEEPAPELAPDRAAPKGKGKGAKAKKNTKK